MKVFPPIDPAVDRRPSHWKVAEFRRVFRPVEVVLGGGDLPALSLSARAGELTERGADARQQPSREYLRRYWEVAPGDLVVNPMWLIGGSIGVSRLRGAVSPDYRVYRSRHLDPRYAHHLLRSQPYFDQYKLLVRAETTFDRRITKQDFHEMPILVPPREEQRAIADYLDAETARIDALIVKKQQLIHLLEERRSAMLERRLHHDLADLPEVPVRHVAVISGGITLGGSEHSGERVRRPYLRVANVQDGYLDLNEITEIDVSLAQASRFELQRGDVLMLEGNGNPDNLGRGTIWRGEIAGCLHQNHIHAVRPVRSRLLPEFFDLAVRAPFARSQLTGGAGQVSIATLSKSDIAALRLPLPPVSRQRAIVEDVRRELGSVERLTRAADRQIVLLAEHRRALVTAAVTGELILPEVA